MKKDDKKKNKGSKGGKPPSGGVGAGGGMGSKASKGVDGGGGMGMFDECVLANPTLEMTDAFASDSNITTDYDSLLEHSILVNEDFSMGVSLWVAENGEFHIPWEIRYEIHDTRNLHYMTLFLC